jgi:hypothetical protein
MKLICRIERIDPNGALVYNTRAPFLLLFALTRLCGGPEPARAAVNKKSRPWRDALERQRGLEQYPINPKNPLHPDETSVSVASNLWC